MMLVGRYCRSHRATTFCIYLSTVLDGSQAKPSQAMVLYKKRPLIREEYKLLVVCFPIDPMYVMFILNKDNGEPTKMYCTYNNRAHKSNKNVPSQLQGGKVLPRKR